MPYIGSKPSINGDAVKYQARTKLAQLADEIRALKRLTSSEAKAKIKKAVMIRLWLKALDYGDFLSKEQKEKIWYALVDLADINDFPVAPILGSQSRPSILLTGTPGEPGEDGEDAGTPFSNSDVDTPSEVVDSFAVTLSNGVKWEYTIKNSIGSIIRKGNFSTGWTSDGLTISAGMEQSSPEIGDSSPVVLSCDISAGNVRLIATVASNNWSISGKRYLD